MGNILQARNSHSHDDQNDSCCNKTSNGINPPPPPDKIIFMDEDDDNKCIRKPKRIILIRHEQSAGNVDDSTYTKVPDWRIPLTQAGKDHGVNVTAPHVASIVGKDPVYVYTSPYVRTIETCRIVVEGIIQSSMSMSVQEHQQQVIGLREEPRIVEQQFGNFQDKETMRRAKKERYRYGSFFYRFPNGESGLDVYNRAATFINTLFRDFCNPRINFDPDYNIIIVTHGLTLRLFLMRWFQFSVEEFETTVNPENGGIVVMERKDTSNSNSEHRDDQILASEGKEEKVKSRSIYYEISEETRAKLNLPDRMGKHSTYNMFCEF